LADGGRFSDFLLDTLAAPVELLLRLELTPGGVDSSRSGTTGEGDVMELKFDSVVVEDEHEEGDGAIAVGNPLGVADVGSVSRPPSEPPVPSVGDSSSSKMQMGGWAGICGMACSRLVSRYDLLLDEANCCCCCWRVGCSWWYDCWGCSWGEDPAWYWTNCV